MWDNCWILFFCCFGEIAAPPALSLENAVNVGSYILTPSGGGSLPIDLWTDSQCRRGDFEGMVVAFLLSESLLREMRDDTQVKLGQGNFHAKLPSSYGRCGVEGTCQYGRCSTVYEEAQSKGVGGPVIGKMFLFYGVAGGAWPDLTVAYCAEILPYNIRAKRLAVNLAMVSLAAVVKQDANPVRLSDLQWYSTLEEIADRFEGEDPYVAHIKDH
ncbi:hypothetical protein SAPIO_CDS1889 [Scedosporium apiospermum]|uniref:Uncharacterized protein n=1 Tax=Pseudallescheria apiosperma TaxID=563466 RepID=A0A084GDZ2_PSEDA|nr:uncharacterized protein SAPIO_CDS1889 [Scedosporium apiospermum]KEZ45554.1 hypothetical protein SAPIO_CDS1889 [Scedosporium apiospermum]